MFNYPHGENIEQIKPVYISGSWIQSQDVIFIDAGSWLQSQYVIFIDAYQLQGFQSNNNIRISHYLSMNDLHISITSNCCLLSAQHLSAQNLALQKKQDGLILQ